MVTVKKVVLWQEQIENKPGQLAGVLKPLADAGTDLEVVMGTSFPGDAGRATIGVFPVSGKKSIAAARSHGLSPTAVPALLVSGDNKVGLASKIAQTIADSGINIGFVIGLVQGKNFSAVFGFGSQVEASKAATPIRKVLARKAAPGVASK